MASDGHHKSPDTSSDEFLSSSSDSSNSTPNTPPTPNAEIFVQPQAPVTPPQTIRASALGYRHSPRSTPIKSRLGIIDEHSDAVSPDVPVRNPLRRFGLPMKFTLDSIPTLHAKKDPPKDIYDDVQGPKGEKFSDLRNNKKSGHRRRCSWRTLVLIAIILVIVVVAILVGVIVGLKVRSNKQRNQEDQSPANSNSTGQGDSPAGSYSIASYLVNVNTSCTTNVATWGCYPQITYSQSPSASLSSLNWIVSANKDGQYVITSADRVFSYNFQNLPLSKINEGTEDEYWHFNTTFDKAVIPSQPITNNGAAAICYFNNTSLDGRLYTKKPRAQALQSATQSTGSSSGTIQPWTHALSFYETHNNGPDVPECFTWTNSQRGSRISITDLTTSNGVTAQCQCNYANFV